MTKEELEKEAEEKYSEVDREFMDCQDEGEIFNLGYLAGAEPREKQIQIDAEQIRALQKQNGELTDKVKELEIRCNELFLQTCEQAEKVKELEALIEKMKCCGDCENGELSAHEEPCLHCQRCFASKDVTDQENVKDNWEAIKEIKEK